MCNPSQLPVPALLGSCQQLRSLAIITDQAVVDVDRAGWVLTVLCGS
jgi:hypothetical protein